MEILLRFLRSNALPRILVGVMLGSYLVSEVISGPSQPQALQSYLVSSALGSSSPAVLSQSDNILKLLDLAENDHIELIEWALKNYREKVHDYQAVLYKQERIEDELKPLEIIAIDFKQEPFSLFMEWQKNAGSIDKLLYVEGQNDNKMVVHPTGLLSWIKSVKKDPRCKQARKSSLRTCDQFGFFRSMQSMLKVYKTAEALGDLEINCLGEKEIDGRKYVIIERVLPRKALYPTARMVLYFDVEYLLPTRYYNYDWEGRLISCYRYQEVELNQGIKSSSFDLSYRGL